MNGVLTNDWTVNCGGLKVKSFTQEVVGDNNQPLVTLNCRLDDLSLRVDVDGLDRPGTLAFVTGLFAEFRVNVEACYGRRLHMTQGSQFELEHSPENRARVLKMLNHLQSEGGEKFRVVNPVAFDRVYSVRVDILKDDYGLLHPLAKVLADKRVNLHSFSAEKKLLGGLNGLPEVCVMAEMELPFGLDLNDLKTCLAAACPEGSWLKFREEYTLVNDQVVLGDDYFVVKT
jgi:glycine cleavage system regulatory protein